MKQPALFDLNKHPLVEATVFSIQKLSDVLEHFEEYKGAESDDTDTICVTQGKTEVKTETDDIWYALYDALKMFDDNTHLKANQPFTVRVYHDCPGCCGNWLRDAETSAFKEVTFICKR